MTNTRPTVFREDQPEDPETTPGMMCGGGDGPADAGSICTANAGKLRAGNAHDGMSRDVAPVPVYYNEFDPGAAQWLRNLMDAGLIPSGVIDTRSIVEVQPDDLDGFVQCHFFAGIGGWPLALSIAGWPTSRPVWTGSCPCPPFSAAGKKFRCSVCHAGSPVPCPRRTGFFICWHCGNSWFADGRHLFPEFWRLIAKRRPATVLGEQVASGDGRTWLAGVRGALEILGYAVGSSDLCSPGAGEEAEGRFVRRGQEWWEPITIGAPQIRQRLYWMADSDSERRDGEPVRIQWRRSLEEGAEAAGRGASGGMADAVRDGTQHAPGRGMGAEATVDETDGSVPGERLRTGVESALGRLADTDDTGPQGRGERGDGTGQRPARSRGVAIECADGKVRRIPESVFLGLADGFPAGVDRLSPRQGYPLAQGVEGRVTALKGIGNAIDPVIASEFIAASMEARA